MPTSLACSLRCYGFGADGLGHVQHVQQLSALGVGLVLQTQAALRIALAGQQGIGKAVGFAKSVAALQQA